jgi:hypothetical protein
VLIVVVVKSQELVALPFLIDMVASHVVMCTRVKPAMSNLAQNLARSQNGAIGTVFAVNALRKVLSQKPERNHVISLILQPMVEVNVLLWYMRKIVL